MKRFENLMVDLETMGTKSFSAITSIGALEFDMATGETGREFLVNVDLKSSVDHGLKIDPATVIWWLGQDKKAQNDMLKKDNQLSLPQALINFTDFINTNSYKVWGNSASFDLGLLGNAYDAVGISRPWQFYNEMCVRTLCNFYPEIKKNEPFKGTAHNALQDCYHQVSYCSKTWAKLRGA
jgi:DNA polymerase III epsilon subunit-like protein